MKRFTLSIIFLLTVTVTFSQFRFVTMSVDMNDYPGSTAPGIFVNGTFNTFCGTCSPLTDPDLDGVWSGTLPIDTTTVANWPEIEWLFTVGNFADVESFSGSATCVKVTGQFINRVAIITSDTVLPEVCWNACVTCDLAPAQRNVTFQVDMSEYMAAGNSVAAGVNVNGTFNGFCGTCWPLADGDGDSIYTGTYLVIGDTAEYLYTIGNFATLESFDTGTACTKTTIDPPNTFTNRLLVMGENDTILDPVCWESCVGCDAAPSCGLQPFTTAIRPTRATLNWPATAGATGYEIEGSEVGFSTITLTTGSGTNLVATGLVSGKSYFYRVRPTAAGGTIKGEWSCYDTFTTCAPPTNLTVTNLTNTSATLSYTPGPANVSYFVAGRPNPGGPSSVVTINNGTNLSLNAINLLPCQQYVWSVYATCEGGSATAIASPNFFTTTGCPSKTGVSDVGGVFVFPNPASATVSIKAESGSSISRVMIADVSGRSLRIIEGENSIYENIDVSEFSAGVYFLNIEMGTNIITEKLIIK